MREAVGPKIFIAATFDLHGNEDEAFLKYADMAFAVKYFPHYDEYFQGERAARTLVRAIRGDYRPAHVTVKVPIISRSPFELLATLPGVQLANPSLNLQSVGGNFVQLIFNGARPRSNNYMLDGQDINDVGIGGQSFYPQVPEMYQAVTALLNSTSMED